MEERGLGRVLFFVLTLLEYWKQQLPFTYEYPRPAVSADTVVIDKQNRTLLLIQRKNNPFAGDWALPGGFMDMDEAADVAAIRELQEETGLKVSEVFQIGAYSKVDRDPRGRVVTIAFLAFASQQEPFAAADDAKDARWFPIDQLPALAFDHAEIVADGLAVLESQA